VSLLYRTRSRADYFHFAFQDVMKHRPGVYKRLSSVLVRYMTRRYQRFMYLVCAASEQSNKTWASFLLKWIFNTHKPGLGIPYVLHTFGLIPPPSLSCMRWYAFIAYKYWQTDSRHLNFKERPHRPCSRRVCKSRVFLKLKGIYIPCDNEVNSYTHTHTHTHTHTEVPCLNSQLGKEFSVTLSVQNVFTFGWVIA
jgi:hypothetical protein